MTVEQKRQVVEASTRTLVDVLGKRPEHIHVVIDVAAPSFGFSTFTALTRQMRGLPRPATTA